MVEHRKTECLAQGVRPEICLEPEGINGWNERLDHVQGRAWDWRILGNVTSEISTVLFSHSHK